MKKNLILKLMGGGKLNAEPKPINDNQTTKIAQSNLKQQTNFFHNVTRKRHYLVCFLLLVGAALSIMESCRKPDDFLETASATNTTNNNMSVDLRSEDNDDKLMVLGEKRRNPYTVEVMTQAWNNLYAPDVTALPATHLYIRFLPTSLEQYAQLGEYDFNLYDFPLENEVIEYGDHYHDPTITADKMTWQYAILKVGREYPTGIQHEVIERLVIAPYASALTEEAFRLTQNAYEQGRPSSEVHGTNPNGDPGGGNPPPSGDPGPPNDPECNPGCPNYPCCETADVFCDDVACTQEDPPAPCNPGGENWPECLNTVTFVPNSPALGECGCPLPNSERIPAGCIQVDDTQLGLQPVRRVKVITKDTWFTEDETWTDDKGCWKMDREYRGRMWMWVKFKSDRTTIRAFRTKDYELSAIWGDQYTIPIPLISEYALAVKDFRGCINGPVFNNIPTAYYQNINDDSNARLYWYSATSNNALHEYYDFAAQDNIGTPPEDLDIMLTNLKGSAATPMLDDISENPLIALSTGAVVVGLAAISVSGGVLAALISFTVIWAPDLVYNYGNDGNLKSDRVKSTMYHEFAHSAHYKVLNNDDYWIDNIQHILSVYAVNSQVLGALPSPYGNGSQLGSERCAVIEMWAELIGATYADRTYGTQHSNSPFYLTEKRYIYLLESLEPNLSMTILDGDWIPWGLFHDCIDNNADNPTGVGDGVPNDQVNGYSIKQCFNAISNSPIQLSTVRNNLINVLPAGQNAANVTSLFTQYGF